MKNFQFMTLVLVIIVATLIITLTYRQRIRHTAIIPNGITDQNRYFMPFHFYEYDTLDPGYETLHLFVPIKPGYRLQVANEDRLFILDLTNQDLQLEIEESKKENASLFYSKFKIDTALISYRDSIGCGSIVIELRGLCKTLPADIGCEYPDGSDPCTLVFSQSPPLFPNPICEIPLPPPPPPGVGFIRQQ